ncbi:MAG: 50S ribosomal protein L19 [Candidatus Paceibacterota bacterium]
MMEINVQDIKPGMYIKILQKIKEGDKEKTQQIEGLVLARKHGNEPGATITLRRIKDGVGMEWIIPLSSPSIQKIELLKASRVRRAKLYFLRNKSSKQAKKKLKITIKEKEPTQVKLEEKDESEA